MRLLKTNKPIPVKYLKLGLDQGAYDIEKLIWLPGRSTPIRVPDLRTAGKHRRGERDASIAPPVPKNKPTAPGLYVPPGYIAKQKLKERTVH
jgi:hypothetical protein